MVADTKLNGNDTMTKLEELVGKKIKSIDGYISHEFDDPVFKLSKIIFEDDTFLWTEGEHDIAYVYNYGTDDILTDEMMEKAHAKEEAEDD